MATTGDNDKIHSIVHEYFVKNNNYGKYSFKGMFRKSIESISQQFFNILAYYFDKYSAEAFHRRMKGSYTIMVKDRDGKDPPKEITLPGFDFIGDWKRFHKTKFAFFIHTVRANKTWFIYDEEKIFNTIIRLMEEKHWTLDEREKESIRMTVRRLYNILYLNWDSVQ